MIKEDYVSNETAKLLKEKGLEGYSIITIYDEDAANAYVKELQEKHLPYSSDDPKLKEFFYTKPTLQMAMKWLREVHNIHIDINTNWAFKDDNFIVVGYMFDTHSAINSWHQDLVNYPTYEQACETAIKYCLENLI